MSIDGQLISAILLISAPGIPVPRAYGREWGGAARIHEAGRAEHATA